MSWFSSLFKRKEINPKDHPRKWIYRHLKNHREYRLVGLDIKYGIDANGNHINGDDYAHFIVSGSKLQPANIQDEDIILVTTLENKTDNTKHPIYLFNDNNICQLAWEGKYDENFVGDIYNKCRSFKKDKAKWMMRCKEFKKLLSCRNGQDIVVAFKYAPQIDGYHKEAYVYDKSDVLGYVQYLYRNERKC